MGTKNGSSAYQGERAAAQLQQAAQSRTGPQCTAGDTSIAAIAATHGLNANLLQRWVSEFRRHGKHDLADLDVTPAPDEGRHIAAANWIPVDGPAKTVGAQVATRVVTIVDAPRPAASPSNTTHQTVGLEVSSSDLRLTLHWLSDDPHGLAGFVRELLR